MKTVVIGLGNPILGDDGVGWVVAEEISRSNPPGTTEVTVNCLSVGGLALMEHLAGYDRAIIVDAFLNAIDSVGTVIQYQLEDLPEHIAGHLTSAHDVSLKTALQLGREMGAQLPGEIFIVGIVARDVTNFSEILSTNVAAAVPQAVRTIQKLLRKTE